MSNNTGKDRSDQFEHHNMSSSATVWIVLTISAILALIAVFGAVAG